MPELERVVAGLSCRDVLTMLADYVDQELSSADRGRVEAHLRACDHCEKFGGEYAALVRRLRAALLPADPDVRATLRSRMQEVWSGEDA